MASDRQPSQGIRRHLIMVRPEPPGQYTAQVVSMPGISVKE